MATIKVKAVVSNLSNVMLIFNQIKVYRSTTGAGGPFVEITAVSTRPALEAGTIVYEYIDLTGNPTYWYQTSYYHSSTGQESRKSDAIQGEGDAALDIVSIDELKTNYLFGLDLTDDAGNPYPNSLYEFFIRSAISWLEHRLDIPISVRTLVDEQHDYYREDYKQYIWMKLKEYPVIQVEEVRMVLPGEQVVQTFDTDWIHIQKESGQLQLVPGTGSAGSILLGAAGAYISMIYRNNRFIPDAFRVDYSAGFEPGQVPALITDVIGKKASFGPLNIAGDLLGGAGIASQSIGIDGLSQSFNTTCLAPETEILLAGGNSESIVELAKKGGSFEVRSLGNDHEACMARATKAFATIQAQVYRVLLSNNLQVECSGNHLFLLHDGRFVEAAKLEPDVELMSVDGQAGEAVRVREIHQTNEVVQMYDLEVPSFARFALGVGVVVHNSSATNSGYGARLIQYTREIKEVLPMLEKFYKGIRMVVV